MKTSSMIKIILKSRKPLKSIKRADHVDMVTTTLLTEKVSNYKSLDPAFLDLETFSFR